MTEENELTHYGVKGMKWGKRKANSTSSEPDSADHTKARALATKKVSSMSNDEIQALGRRLQLEKSYRDLTKTPSKFEKGHAQVKTALGVAATASSVYAFVNSPLGKGIKTAVGTATTTAKSAAAAKAAKTVVDVGTELVLRR